MRHENSLLVLCFALPAATLAHPVGIEPVRLSQYAPSVFVDLSDERVVELRINDEHVEAVENALVNRLSSLDFMETHVLAADVTGDGVSDLLVEVLPSRSGSCYELWSTTATGYARHEGLLCNPSISPGGTLITNERDGPYSRIVEYEPDQAGGLHWVRRQEPLSPDFSRYERRREDGSIARSVIYLGLPGCGEARINVPHPVRVSGTPGGPETGKLDGEFRILDVQQLGPRDEWVLVKTGGGEEGWLPSVRLGDLEAAARLQCIAGTDGYATYKTSLIQRDGTQYLARESFTNEKRVLLVELLQGRRTGRVLSVHRNLMALDASGSPAWTGIEVLDSKVPLDEGVWESVFKITDALPAPKPDASGGAQPGTVIPVRIFNGEVAIGEHRMFSPTATEAPVDVSRLGSLPRCSAVVESGGLARYAVATGNQRTIDVALQRDHKNGVTGAYRLPGEAVDVPLTGRWDAGAVTLRSMDGQILFEGRGRDAWFTGRWTLPQQEPTEAVLGCAELWPTACVDRGGCA